MMTFDAMSDATRARILKIMELASSDNAGERAAAIASALRIMDSQGCRFSDLLNPQLPARRAPPPQREAPQGRWSPPPTQPPPRPLDDDDYEGWQQVVALCLREQHRLTTWEFDFLQSLGRRSRLSEKQTVCLHQICVRLGFEQVED